MSFAEVFVWLQDFYLDWYPKSFGILWEWDKNLAFITHFWNISYKNSNQNPIKTRFTIIFVNSSSRKILSLKSLQKCILDLAAQLTLQHRQAKGHCIMSEKFFDWGVQVLARERCIARVNFSFLEFHVKRASNEFTKVWRLRNHFHEIKAVLPSLY